MVNSRLPPEKNEDCQDKKSWKVREEEEEVLPHENFI